MSPGHMATVAQAEPSSVERLRALILAGTSKETRDRAAAEKTLEATVAGHEQLLQVLRDVALEHDSHLAPLLQRTAQLETSVGAAVAHASTAKANMEAAQTALNTELSEYAQRMSVEMAASGERVTALESRTAGSFAQAEELFQRCDALLGEARAGTAQVAAAVAKGTSETSPDVKGPPVTYAPGLPPVRARVSDDGLINALRQRVDDISRELLARQEVDVAVQLNLQQGTTDTRALQEWAHQSLIDLSHGVIASEAALKSEMQALRVATAGGACKCTGSNAHTAAGPGAAPSGGFNCLPCGVPAMPTFAGAAQGTAATASQAPYGHQGVGGGGAGGTSWYNMGTPDGAQARHAHGPVTKTSRPLFDCKDAKDNLPRYNGREKGAIWRKKITYYLVGRCSDIRNLLRWAELQEEPITEASVRRARMCEDTLQMMEIDPVVISYHLWAFLNVSLLDDAWAIYDAAEMENGLEVWRRVNLEVTQRTQAEIMDLEEAAVSPTRLRASALTGVPQALVSWDAAVRDYIEAGGEQLTPDKAVSAILRLLPADVLEKALWDFDSFKGHPERLRTWLRSKARLLKKRTPGGGMHTFDDVPGEPIESDGEEELGADAEDGEILAFHRRKLARRPGAPGAAPRRTAPPRREAPPRDARDVRCPNCLNKGHASQACPHPKKSADERACFDCGKTGHMARKCPNKSKSVATLETQKPVSLNGAFNVLNSLDDGFTPVTGRRRAAAGPTSSSGPPSRAAPRSSPAAPRAGNALNLGMYMTSVFSQLAELEGKDVKIATPGTSQRTSTASSSATRPSPQLQERPCDPLPCPLRYPSHVDRFGNEFNAGRVALQGSVMEATDLETILKPEAVNMLFAAVNEELLVAEEVEPEFIEVEATLDTGATVHAVDRVDIPKHEVKSSAGSRAGRLFQAAGGSFLEDEGEAELLMFAPGHDTELAVNFAVAKVTRPLLSVPMMTDSGDIDVLCRKTHAYVLEVATQKVLATFVRKGGLYVCKMRVRNPRWTGFARPGC